MDFTTTDPRAKPGDAPARVKRGPVICHTLFDPVTGEARWQHRRQYYTDGTKDVRWRSLNATGKWTSGLNGVRPSQLPLWNAHRLSTVSQNTRIVLVEGEMAGQALDARRSEVGDVFVLATVTGAPDAPTRDVLMVLKSHHVILWRDHDTVGAAMMRKIANELTDGIAASVRWIDWRTAEHKQDAADHLRLHGAEATRALIEAAVDAMPSPPPADPDRDPRYRADDASRRSSKKRATQGELLAGVIREAQRQGAELFHDPDQRAYVTLPVGGHRETWPVRSHGFRSWLSSQYYKTQKKLPGASVVEDFLRVLEGQAIFEGIEYPVFVRVGVRDDHVYLDLCDPEWRVIDVTTARWMVLAHSPIKFLRARGMAALPCPTPGGRLDALRPFINVAGDDADTNTSNANPIASDWVLVAAWLVGALNPRGPYPILALFGEQGTSKSTTARLLRAVIDPSTVPLRCEPRDERDLMVAARHGWVLAFDNLSRLPPWLSDAICRVATGGGLGTRALYTDDDEMLFAATRPIVINAIEELATRGDLLDRLIVVKLPPIPDTARRPEAELWRDFEAARPAILGALLDVVVRALARQAQTKVTRSPRMADFVRWVVAAESAAGWPEGAFLKAYWTNRTHANDMALEAVAPVPCLQQLLDQQPLTENGTREWTGQVGDLLEAIKRLAPEPMVRSKTWPKSPRALRGMLDRIAPNLRAIGITLTFSRSKRQIVTLVQGGGNTDDTDDNDGDASTTQPPDSVDPASVADNDQETDATTDNTADANASDGPGVDPRETDAQPTPNGDPANPNKMRDDVGTAGVDGYSSSFSQHRPSAHSLVFRFFCIVCNSVNLETTPDATLCPQCGATRHALGQMPT